MSTRGLWPGRTWRHNWICINGQADSGYSGPIKPLLSLFSGMLTLSSAATGHIRRLNGTSEGEIRGRLSW
jgi:hypothetical protein